MISARNDFTYKWAMIIMFRYSLNMSKNEFLNIKVGKRLQVRQSYKEKIII